MTLQEKFKAKLQEILNTKTEFKNVANEFGGNISTNTNFNEYPKVYKALLQNNVNTGAGESGYAIEVYTHEDMDATLIEANLEKLYIYKGESDDTYVNGMIYMVVESDTVIPSGVGATLYQDGGYEPVPINAVVDKVIFNTSVSTNDVKNILSQITFADPAAPFYVVYANSVANIQLGIMDYGITLGVPGLYLIAGILQGDMVPVWVDPQLSSYMDGLSGWNYAGFEQLGGNEFPLGYVNESTYVDEEYGTLQVGLQNDVLASIINIGEKPPIEKQLTGEYEGIKVRCGKNGTYDLTSYIDNKTIPTQVSVNVPLPTTRLQSKEVVIKEVPTIITHDIDYDGLKEIEIERIDYTVDSNIQRENIKEGVTILGMTGEYKGLIENYTNELVDIPNYTYKDIDKFKGITFTKVENIGEGAFLGCQNLSSIRFEDTTLKKIGKHAFVGAFYTLADGTYDYSSLSGRLYIKSLDHWFTVDFDEECGFGADKCYVNDEPLNDLTIPSSFTETKPHMFYRWRLTNLYLPNNFTKICSKSLGGVENLYIDSLKHWLNVEIEDDSGFYYYHLYINNSKLTGALYIPSDVEHIGADKFQYNEDITSVSAPNVKSVGSYAFYYCDKVKSMSFPLLEEIGEYAFGNVGRSVGMYGGLTSLSFPNLKVVTYKAFARLNVTSLTLNVCEKIEAGAFDDTEITRIRILNTTSMCILEENEDSWTRIHELYVPNNLLEAYRADPNWSKRVYNIYSTNDWPV